MCGLSAAAGATTLAEVEYGGLTDECNVRKTLTRLEHGAIEHVHATKQYY